MNKCEHNYKVLDEEVTRWKADNFSILTDVDVVFYCEKCLDMVRKRKKYEGDDD